MPKIKQKRKEVKTEIKETKQKSLEKFDYKMTENYKDNQKLFYGTLKQIRNKNE